MKVSTQLSDQVTAPFMKKTLNIESLSLICVIKCKLTPWIQCTMVELRNRGVYYYIHDTMLPLR